MLFNSPVYVFLFLPLVVVVYFMLNRHRLVMAGKAWLVLASLFFYSYWNPVYVLLILVSILVNFGIGSALNRTNAGQQPANIAHWSRKTLLTAGILFNLGLLGYFKYADFFITNFNQLFDAGLPLLNLLLPLAISFFTFQQIAYLVDSFQSDTQEHDFLNYCLFVTFFPQLIAGPIVHHREMMPQFRKLNNKLINWRNVIVGGFIFGMGLVKKVAIADTFAVWADAGFDSTAPLGFFEAWGASLSYTFQLYYDFSGYSDMAIGAALLFNIHLPMNFNSPYKAVNIQDFWRRWHMTLSRWLRDYLYFPLGGSRKGPLLTYCNLGITFLLGGLWHGAGWTFVAWGALHGLAVSVHRLWSQLGYRMNAWLGWLLTFLFVNLAWVFFRANDFHAALRMLDSMTDLSSMALSLKFVDQLSSIAHASLHDYLSWRVAPVTVPEWSLVVASLALAAVLMSKNSMQQMENILSQRTLTIRQAGYFSLLCGAGLWFVSASSSEVFLYFNF